MVQVAPIISGSHPALDRSAPSQGFKPEFRKAGLYLASFRFLTLTCLSSRIVKSILNSGELDGLSMEGLREVPIRWEEKG